MSPQEPPQTPDVPLWSLDAQVDYVVTPALAPSPEMALLAGNLHLGLWGLPGAEPGDVRLRQPRLGCGPGLCVGGEEGPGQRRWSEGRETETRETKKNRGSSPAPGSEAAQEGSDMFGVFAGLEPCLPGLAAPASRIRSAPSKSLRLAERCPPRPALARGAKRGGRRGCALDRRARGAPWWQVWGAQRPAPPRS